jgi:hypothetical protein
VGWIWAVVGLRERARVFREGAAVLVGGRGEVVGGLVGPSWVGACKDRDEVSFEGLYHPFRFIRSFCEGWHEFVFDVRRYEVLS